MPGEVEPTQPCATSELRCRVGPEIFQLLRHARRMLSIQQNRFVTTAETLEWVLSAYLSSKPLNRVELDRLRCQTERDLAADFSRTLPLVETARELAVEMGYLEPSSEEDEPGRVDDGSLVSEPGEGEDLMRQALGGPLPRGAGEWIGPGRVQEEQLQGYAFWRNGRLRFNPRKRHATRAQRKEILRRDGYRCSTPGCPHFAWLHIHHLVPFAKGGLTSEENLVCLCTRCHKNVHNGHLVIEQGESGRLVFKDGKGRRLDRAVETSVARWLDTWLAEGQPMSYERQALVGAWPLRSGQGTSFVREGFVAGDWAC